MTRVRDVIKELKSLTEENIDDPVSMRANDGGTWVFDHFPKHGKGKTLPRIGFYRGPSSLPQTGLGDVTTYEEGDINAGIFVKRKSSFDFNNDGENEPAEDLIEYLAEQVKEVVEDNQPQFKSLGDDVSYVKPLDINDPVKPENENYIFQQIVFEVRID